jgi:hypothetical protein
MTEKLVLPTDEEREAAHAAFEQGEFEPLKTYLEQSFAWYVQAARPFDEKAFAAAVQARGEPFDERVMRGAKRVSDSIRDGFREKAASFAFMLGLHSSLLLLTTDALTYFRRAAELDPKNERYREKLLELES